MNVMIETEQREKAGEAKKNTTKIGTRNLKTTDRNSSPERKDSTMTSVLIDSANPPKTASHSRQERRRQRRASVKVLVRLRPANNTDEKFEEVLGTHNASRANLYVISASRCYYKQMPLRVAFPFDSAHDNGSTSEETAEVVRLDHLPDGRVGVAILFRKPIATTANKSNSTGMPKGERRFALRHSVSAKAKLTDLATKTDLEGRCSDLSVAGCYIDTLNPFPEKASVHLQLTNTQNTLDVDAHVITHHIGMGMGLVFDGLGPEQTMVLVNWLSKRTAQPLLVVEQSASTKPSAPSQPLGSSDRALVAKLLRMLESNGNLTKDDISKLLSEPVIG
jgi:hypothetical protein